jgi:predicted RNA-binding Zn ribbon-like protein
LTVVDAVDEQERARGLNTQMAAAAAYPRLTDHNDEGWHLHYRDSDQTLPHVLLSVISVGTALHLTTRGMHRLSRCAGETSIEGPCTSVVVDVTRNGRQRYCSVRCANQAAVRRHRAKTAPLGASGNVATGPAHVSNPSRRTHAVSPLPSPSNSGGTHAVREQ